MDLLTMSDRRSRLLMSREYMLAANRLARQPPWHSGGRRWAVSASTVAMAEREGLLVPGHQGGCPPTFWSLQRSSPAKPGMRRAKTAHAASYAERTRFKPEQYRAEPCENCDTIRQCLNNEFVRNFDVDQLRHVETSTRNTLPTQETISDERRAILGGRSNSARWGAVVKRNHSVHFFSAPTTSQGDRQRHSDGNVSNVAATVVGALQNIENEET